MTLVIFCLFPLIVINGSIFNKFAVKYKIKVLDYYSKAAVIAEETISTIRTTVAFSQQKNVSNIYKSKLDDAKLTGIKSSTINGMNMGMMNFLIYDTYALAFWYGSTLILKGEATSGEVSIF